MFAFTRFIALTLFLVALIMTEHVVVALPMRKPAAIPNNNYSGASGSADGGNVINPQPACSGADCTRTQGLSLLELDSSTCRSLA